MFEKFVVSSHRSIQRAECSSVPSVMIIVGPNGSGKSTLLDFLRNNPQDHQTRPIYIGPHRASRRQNFGYIHLSRRISVEEAFSRNNVQAFDGLRIQERSRTAWDQDEATSLVKFGLCQIELDRREAVTDRLDAFGSVSKDDIPDVWAPVEELTRSLIPHLEFGRIDISDRNNVRCLWRIRTSGVEVDLDDLSSGEKSIIQIPYPVIENLVKSRISELKGTNAERTKSNNCILIDEPELHLHPNLQGGLLNYIRNLASDGNHQFIMATHSPYFAEHSHAHELFVLQPSRLVVEGANQLFQIADDQKRLDALREIFGSVSNLTSLKPILVVEGVRGDSTAKSATDQIIYSLFSTQFRNTTIVPGGGKSECLTLISKLVEAVGDLPTRIETLCLVDRDTRGVKSGLPNVMALPVSTIENFLLNPEAIWRAVRSVHHKLKLKSAEEVGTEIYKIATGLAEIEIERRVKSHFSVSYFRLGSPTRQSQDQVDTFVESLKAAFSEDKIENCRILAEQEVNRIIDEKEQLKLFDGKKILSCFFKEHVASSGMSREIFLHQCAIEVADTPIVSSFVKDVTNRLKLQ